MRVNTPTAWEAFRKFIGLPGKTRVSEIPNERLAMYFFGNAARTRGESVISEQERAEFGCPAIRNNTHMEA